MLASTARASPNLPMPATADQHESAYRIMRLATRQIAKCKIPGATRFRLQWVFEAMD